MQMIPPPSPCQLAKKIYNKIPYKQTQKKITYTKNESGVLDK